MSFQQSSSETKMTVTCPECGGAMTISAVNPAMFDNVHEEITY